MELFNQKILHLFLSEKVAQNTKRFDGDVDVVIGEKVKYGRHANDVNDLVLQLVLCFVCEVLDGWMNGCFCMDGCMD